MDTFSVKKAQHTSSIVLKDACEPAKGVYGQWHTSVKAYACEIDGIVSFPFNYGNGETEWFNFTHLDGWIANLDSKVVVSITFSRKVKVNTTNAFEVLVAQKGKDKNDNERSIHNLASEIEISSEHHYAVSLQDNGEGGVRWLVHSEVTVELEDGRFKVTEIPYSRFVGLSADQIAQIIGRAEIS